MSTALKPLAVSATALTAATAPTAGQITRYDATGGALAPPLPAIAGLNVGAMYGLQKDEADSSANIITITCSGSDTLVSGATTATLKLKGSWKVLEVVSIGGTKKWQVVDAHDTLAQLDARYALAPLGTAATANIGTTAGTVPVLGTGGVMPIARLATGTPTGSKFVRDDGTLAAPAGGVTQAQAIGYALVFGGI